MTDRTPRTMSADPSVIEHLKKLYQNRSSYAYELTFHWETMKQVIDAFDAERAVSRALAEALEVYADPQNFVEGNDWFWVGDDDPKAAARAALAQYAAQGAPQASGDVGADAGAKGGRE